MRAFLVQRRQLAIVGENLNYLDRYEFRYGAWQRVTIYLRRWSQLIQFFRVDLKSNQRLQKAV